MPTLAVLVVMVVVLVMSVSVLVGGKRRLPVRVDQESSATLAINWNLDTCSYG